MFLFWGWVNRKPYLTLSPREGIFFWVGGRKFLAPVLENCLASTALFMGYPESEEM